MSDALLKTIYQSANNSIVLTDPRGNIVFANDYFMNLTGYDMEALKGNLPKLIKSGVHPSAFYEDLWRVISGGEEWRGFFINRRKNGTLFYEEATISPIVDENGAITHFLKIGRNVDKERLHENQLGKEMVNAKKIVQDLFPLPTQTEQVAFDYRFHAYNHLGGDFIYFNPISEKRHVVGLIDVMGHGVSATLMGIQAITLLDALLPYEKLLDVVETMNLRFSQKNTSDSETFRFLSGLLIDLDFEAQTFSYISLGHPDFYGLTQTGECLTFSSNNTLLGVDARYGFKETVCSLDGLSQLFLFSDGLLEINPMGGEDVIVSHLKEALENRASVLDHFEKKLVASHYLEDDLSMCTMDFRR